MSNFVIWRALKWWILTNFLTDFFDDFFWQLFLKILEKMCTLMCIHPVVVTGLGRAQRIAQTKLDKRLLSAHRWASVNHTFSTSIHIDFFSVFSWINEFSRVDAISAYQTRIPIGILIRILLLLTGEINILTSYEILLEFFKNSCWEKASNFAYTQYVL